MSIEVFFVFCFSERRSIARESHTRQCRLHAFLYSLNYFDKEGITKHFKMPMFWFATFQFSFAWIISVRVYIKLNIYKVEWMTWEVYKLTLTTWLYTEKILPLIHLRNVQLLTDCYIIGTFRYFSVTRPFNYV